MIPTFINTNGALTCEELVPNSYLIRCLEDPEKPLGYYKWVANLIKKGTCGFVKGFKGEDPKLSELHSMINIGMSLGMDSAQWERLDAEGNLVVTKQIWREKNV